MLSDLDRVLVPDKNIARGRFLHPGHHLHTPVDGLDTVCTPFQESLAPTCTPRPGLAGPAHAGSDGATRPATRRAQHKIRWSKLELLRPEFINHRISTA